MFQITFHREPYRNIVAGCLLNRISTVLYSFPVQAGDILVTAVKIKFSLNLIFCYFFQNLSNKFKFHKNLTNSIGHFTRTAVCIYDKFVA